MLSVEQVPKNFPSETIRNVTIINGDSFEVMQQYPDYHFDSGDFSPPYYNKDFGCKDDREYYAKIDLFLSQICEKKITDFVLMFNSSTRLIDICRLMKPIEVLTWYKIRSETPYRTEPVFVFEMPGARFNFSASRFSSGYHVMADVDPIENKTNGEEETPFHANPVELHEVWLLNILTFRNGGKFTRRVVDPFAGSGSLGKAALDLGLECVLIEKDPSTFEQTVKDLKNWKGLLRNPKTRERIKHNLESDGNARP